MSINPSVFEARINVFTFVTQSLRLIRVDLCLKAQHANSRMSMNNVNNVPTGNNERLSDPDLITHSCSAITFAISESMKRSVKCFQNY